MKKLLFVLIVIGFIGCGEMDNTFVKDAKGNYYQLHYTGIGQSYILEKIEIPNF